MPLLEFRPRFSDYFLIDTLLPAWSSSGDFTWREYLVSESSDGLDLRGSGGIKAMFQWRGAPKRSDLLSLSA